MSSIPLYVAPAVVVVNSSGASSGAAERCLMHLKRMQCATHEKSDALQNRIVVQHDDAHAIIVLHVDPSSCTPIIGGGIALESLHCTAQYMLLSLLYRSTTQEAQCGLSHFSLVVVGLHPRLLVDCTKVTRSNIEKSLVSLANHMLAMPSLLNSQQSHTSRPNSDLDFFISTCLSIAQSRPYKPGIIMITECNISSSSSQPISASAIALAVADCSFSVIKPVTNARTFPFGCIPDENLMSFIARRSGGVMWVPNLAILGAVLITPDLFGSLDKLASRSHLLPEIQIILDAVSQRCSTFPQGRALETQHSSSTLLSLQTMHPSLGGPGGVVSSNINQPRLLHKDAQNSNMLLWISSKARLGFVSRVLRRAIVGGNSLIIGAQMVLAVAPGVELVASAVVASETDTNSLIVQIHCDGLRFSDTAKQQPQSLQQQGQHTPPHQQTQSIGMRSAGHNGPLHNEVLQLAELLVFLDRQLARFVRIPYEPNPTITESTHDTILFLLSIPSPHLLPSMPMHHEFILLSAHPQANAHRTKYTEQMNRRGSTVQAVDTADPFPVIETALAAWGSVCKSGSGAGVAMAWKFAIKTVASNKSPSDSNGCVDGVTVLICMRARVCAGIAVFDAFGFNCPHSLIKSECDSVVSTFLQAASSIAAPCRLHVPLSLWVSPAAFGKAVFAPLTAPAPHTPKSSSDKSMVTIPHPSVAGKRLSTFSSALHPCQSVQNLLLQTMSHTISVHSCTAPSLATILAQSRMAYGFAPFMIQSTSDVSVSRETAIGSRISTPSITSFPFLANILVIAVLPPSLRGPNSNSQSCSLALTSTCLISGDHSVEMRLAISLWNPVVCESVLLCETDIEWFCELASAFKVLDERIAHAFAFKTAIHTVLNPSSGPSSRDAAIQLFEHTSGSCLLQLSSPSNSDRFLFASPHSSISITCLFDALSSDLHSRYPACMSKNIFAAKIDDSHIGVILLSQTSDEIVVDAVVLPEQDSNEPSDSFIGDMPLNIATLLLSDDGKKASIFSEAMSPVLKDWLRNSINACERILSNAAFRFAHQRACQAPETIDSAGMLKVLGLAQCISIDITFADLLSVNEKTATSLFGNISLFQSLSPEHIQRVENAIADAISDHRATDAMLSFCSATSANGVYAMNIKHQQPSLVSRRSSAVGTINASLSIDTAVIDDLQSALSPSMNSTFSSAIDASDSFVPDIVTPTTNTPLENDLMFVRIGQLTSDGLVLDYLCEHSSGTFNSKLNRLDSARKQDVSILQSLNARLSVRAISVYHLVAGTVSSCVLSILQSRRPLPDMLFQAVNTLMSSARYAPPAMRPSESSFTGHFVAVSGVDESASTYDSGAEAQLVIDNLTLNRVSFHFAFVLFAPTHSGVTWLCLVQLPRDSSVVVTPATTLQDVALSVIIPFWIVLRVTQCETSSICVDSWILTDRDDRESLSHSVKLHVEFALLHANQYLLMQRLLQTRKLPSLLAQTRNSFSSAPLPEATRFPWGKPVSQWPNGSCGCRIIHQVILEVHYRLDIGDALASIISQSFLRPWKIENASDVFIIGTEPDSCVYAHVSRLEPRESSLQRSTSPTLSTNNSIIIRFHGVSESSCVDLQPFCSAISQRLQALCVQNLLGIIQRNPSLRLSREDVDLLADPASTPTEVASFFTQVHGTYVPIMKHRLADLVSRVFFRLRFLDRRPAVSGITSTRAADSDDAFDFEDGAVFRFVRVGSEGGRNSDAWRGKAMSRGVAGEAMSVALCRFSCTFFEHAPSTEAIGLCHHVSINSAVSGDGLRLFDSNYFCQGKGGLLLECKMWIIGSMPSSVSSAIVSKVSSLVSTAALESSCVCSVAEVAESVLPMSLINRANRLRYVLAASVHASSQLSKFKTINFTWNAPLPTFAVVCAFSLISGFAAPQYTASCRMLLERDCEADDVFAVETNGALFARFKAGDDFIEEEARWTSQSGDGLQRRLIALFFKVSEIGSSFCTQYCILEVTASSATACLYAADGVTSSALGDLSNTIECVLHWTFLRNTLVNTVLNQKAALQICEPENEFFTISVTALGVDGILCGEGTNSEARVESAGVSSVDYDGPSEVAPLPSDEMQHSSVTAACRWIRLGQHVSFRAGTILNDRPIPLPHSSRSNHDSPCSYTFAPNVVRAFIADGAQRQRWLSNNVVRRLLSLLQRVRRSIHKLGSSDDPVVCQGKQLSALDPPSSP